jgi:hypothetical protein
MLVQSDCIEVELIALVKETSLNCCSVKIDFVRKFGAFSNIKHCKQRLISSDTSCL